MNPDIEKVIEQLEAKIAELEKARDTLVETFCQPDSPRRRMLAARQASTPTVTTPAYGPETTIPSGGRMRRRRTRKDIVTEFIRQHGPSTRAQILAGAGVPPGSVAFVLNDRARFYLKDGRWHNAGAAPPEVGAPSSEASSSESPPPGAENPERNSEN